MMTPLDQFELTVEYAPAIAHGLWWTGSSYDLRDLITRVDLDSWDRVPYNYLLVSSSANVAWLEKQVPLVYCWVREYKDYWFIGYAIYHPYDWCSDWWRMFKGLREADEHPNDMEGLVIGVSKKTEYPVVVFTVRHWDILPYCIEQDEYVPFLHTGMACRPPASLILDPLQDLDNKKLVVHMHAGSHALDCWGTRHLVSKWAHQEEHGQVVKGLIYERGFGRSQVKLDCPGQVQFVRYDLRDISMLQALDVPKSAVFGKRKGVKHSTFLYYDEQTGKVIPGKAVPPWGWKSVNEPESLRGQVFSNPAAFAARYFRLGKQARGTFKSFESQGGVI